MAPCQGARKLKKGSPKSITTCRHVLQLQCACSGDETYLPSPLMPLAPRARHLWRSISSGSVAVLAKSADFFFISCSWRSVAAMVWRYRTGESLRENVLSCKSQNYSERVRVRVRVHAQMTSPISLVPRPRAPPSEGGVYGLARTCARTYAV